MCSKRCELGLGASILGRYGPIRPSPAAPSSGSVLGTFG
jgi:hypothetical protein